MRIALVSEFFYPTLGGVQEHLYHVAREYLKRGHEVKIVTPKIFQSGDVSAWWPQGLPRECYCPVGLSLPFYANGSKARVTVGLTMRPKLKELLSKKHFDVVHLHAPLFGTLPIMANHFASVPVVGTFHTSFPGSKNLEIFRSFAQRHIDKLSGTIAVSPIALQSMRNFLDLDAEIIPNGIDTSVFAPRSEVGGPWYGNLGDGRINILFIGRPDLRNGLDTLIRAFRRVIYKEPKARLIVAGGGRDMARYKEATDGLPPGSVIFTGQVRDERPELYRSCHIHVFPVEKATFSITLLEGMSSGLAVVTTPFDGVEALGEAGTHFLTAGFGNDVEVENQLMVLLGDQAKREEMGKAARKHSLQYDWSIIADRVIKVYERALASSAT